MLPNVIPGLNENFNVLTFFYFVVFHIEITSSLLSWRSEDVEGKVSE